MSPTSIDQALDRAEAALDAGRGLQDTGFWKAVGRARRDPRLAEIHADRIARIDRRAFEAGVKLRVPVWAGNLLLGAGTAAGVVAIAAVPRLDGVQVAGLLGDVLPTLVFLAGFAALLVCTHSLAHWIVGRLFGIRFTHYFLGGPAPPRPGVKTDYTTYLRVSPRRRAIMHASGAVVTKIVPFALMPAGWAMGVELWALGVLAVVGVAGIVTDVTLSTKTSDWKRVRRELQAASRR